MHLPSYWAAVKQETLSLQKLCDLLYQAVIRTIQHQRECQAIVKQLVSFYFPIDATDFILDTFVVVTPAIQHKLLEAVNRINQQEPLQYILGSAYFAGNYFKVTADVFIPRPETEEWVTYLINHIATPAAILELGTGSGCIAITLKQQFPQASVEALDISQKALDIARYNAQQLGAAVNFMKLNMLTDVLPSSYWSLMVSNPPYVRKQEKKQMLPNVLNYEPHLALFVDDADPLLFYKHISYLAWHHLSLNGILCLEINETLGKKIVALLQQRGFKQIALHRDIHAKERWVIAVR
ncbi:MAG: peptide chain release factor N(5)-glutamine methyltransferase [Candidatus Cardinium sp.]|nr:peptide chain release factor N(5)-glutamine methyltransferase [Candidatus Cardinium sp.]